MLDEKAACVTISPYLYILSYRQVKCYPPFWQLHSEFRGFNNGVCHAMKITSADSNPDMLGLDKHFTLALMFWAKASRMLMMSIASCQGHLCVYCVCVCVSLCVCVCVWCVCACVCVCVSCMQGLWGKVLWIIPCLHFPTPFFFIKKKNSVEVPAH